jgi:outer membrane putative beta-barrel porin/alpha-amylase
VRSKEWARLGVLSLSLLTPHTLLLTPVFAQTSAGISDNSFLIEEAYNQDPGVVQHISNFSRAEEGGSWAFSFTQEWPLRGLRHQLSYSIPLQHGDGTGVGDVALNYRYQLVGSPDTRIATAPRLTLLLPTGNEEHGRGSGGLGFQANFPLSFMATPQLATHWNAGLTLVPSASDGLGDAATTISYNLGASGIWLVRPSFNLMLELVWLSTESAIGSGLTNRSESFLLNPGIRWAFNFASGLQIVPGIAYTIDLESEGTDALFLYLSFEHPF